MPEGPSILILKEAVQSFAHKKVMSASGNAKIDLQRLSGKTIIEFRTWGKHFLICFNGFFIKIHLLMFGSFLINEKKEAKPRIHLQFSRGELNFYNCSVKLIEGSPDDVYDFTADVLNEKWNARNAKKKLLAKPDMLVCDALLDQQIFSGVGNIIKNEVLFRIKIHPESRIGALPPKLLSLLVKEAVVYSHQFLEWKKAFVLKQHWLAHNKKTCPRDNILFTRKHLGITHRRSFYCVQCQQLYR